MIASMSNRSCSCCCDPCCDPCCPRYECDDKKRDKHDHDDEGSLLKFSGILEVGEFPLTYYLGDAGPVELWAEIPVTYPVARRTRLKNLAVNVTPPVLVPPGALLSVQLFKNGVPVPGFLLTWNAGETTGVKLAKTDELKLSKGDLFDLRATLSGFPYDHEEPLEITVAATVGVK